MGTPGEVSKSSQWVPVTGPCDRAGSVNWRQLSPGSTVGIFPGSAGSAAARGGESDLAEFGLGPAGFLGVGPGGGVGPFLGGEGVAGASGVGASGGEFPDGGHPVIEEVAARFLGGIGSMSAMPRDAIDPL